MSPRQPSLRQRALRLLTQREHTASELARKLAGHGEEDEISELIRELQALSLQSDARAAQSFLRAKGERLGAARLRQSLRKRGVEAELVEQELAAAPLADELERARALWQRKFGAVPTDAKDWARQARFLQSRGFSADLIRRLLREPEGDA